MIVTIKYLKSPVKQDYGIIKRRVRPMVSFKSVTSAASIIKGIELVNMIRKGQFTPELRPFTNFVSSRPKAEKVTAPYVNLDGFRQSLMIIPVTERLSILLLSRQATAGKMQWR